MTQREYAKANRHIGEAWEDGKDVQHTDLYEYGWFDWTLPHRPGFYDTRLMWRVKPEPKLRPWTAEEVPVGAIYRNICQKQIGWATIAEINDTGFWFTNNREHHKFDVLMLLYAHSTDGGKTWNPCGVVE